MEKLPIFDGCDRPLRRIKNDNIFVVLTPEEKKYILSHLESSVSEEELNEEIERAKTAEQANANAIATETRRAIELENNISLEVDNINKVIPEDTDESNLLVNFNLLTLKIQDNKDTFKITYGLTPFSEILTALNKGLIVYGYEPNKGSLFFLFKRVDDIAYFISFSDTAEFGYFTVDDSDNYSNVHWYSFENVRNKTDNIKEFETSSANYPSTKGVVDYVDEGHEVIVNALLNLEERKQDNLTFDDVPTADSDNPVKSKGIKKELNTLDESIQGINNVIPSGTSSSNKLINESQKGAANGIANLDANRKVPGEQLNFAYRGRINASDINDHTLEAGMYSIIGQNITDIFNNANGCLIQISDEYHTLILCVGRAIGAVEGTVVETFVRRYLNSANSWTEWSNSLRSYYTKAQIDNLIQTINQFKYEIYPSLQDITNPQGNVLYLIGPTGTGSDHYEEYVYVISEFQKIGDTSIDLSDYVTITALTRLLEDKQDVLTFDTTPTANSSNPVTSGGIKTAIDAKQDTLESGTNVKTINNQSVLGNGNLDVKDVFIAEYGVTSAQDTWNAVQAGKIVIVERNNLYYYPEQRGSGSSIRFFGLAYLNTFWYFDLYPTSWGGYMYYSWQRESEKVTTFTENIDNTKYPTTKAVADYVDDIVGDINSILETI